MLEAQVMSIYAGIAVGVLLLLSVSAVWWRKQILGMGGCFLSLIGVTLIGLSIWKSVNISVGKDGLQAQFNALEQRVNQVAQAGQTVTKAVQDMAVARETDQKRLLTVAESVQQRQTLAPMFVESFRAETAKPAVDTKQLEFAAEALRNASRK